MNKAFLREPDDNGQRQCPRCGNLGELVPEETLAAQLQPAARATLGTPAFFCAHPACPVAYFDLWERVAEVEQLVQPVYPKDPAAPLCPCFGLTRDDVEADLDEGSVSRVRSVVERAKTPAARCSQLSPTGQSCVAVVQRYYMQRRQARGSG